MLKRPQDYPRTEIAELARAAREHELVELYEKARVRVADGRPDVPRELPFVMPFNKWAANLPGTTYFLPVNELSAFYINVLLSAFSEEFGISWWTSATASGRRGSRGSPGPEESTCETIREKVASPRSRSSRPGSTSSPR